MVGLSGEGWLGPGQTGNPDRHQYDLLKGWVKPGENTDSRGVQYEMDADFNPADSDIPWHYIISPPGTPAPAHALNYTPDTGELHAPGAQAPIDMLNMSVIPQRYPKPAGAEYPQPQSPYAVGVGADWPDWPDDDPWGQAPIGGGDDEPLYDPRVSGGGDDEPLYDPRVSGGGESDVDRYGSKPAPYGGLPQQRPTRVVNDPIMGTTEVPDDSKPWVWVNPMTGQPTVMLGDKPMPGANTPGAGGNPGGGAVFLGYGRDGKPVYGPAAGAGAPRPFPVGGGRYAIWGKDENGNPALIPVGGPAARAAGGGGGGGRGGGGGGGGVNPYGGGRWAMHEGKDGSIYMVNDATGDLQLIKEGQPDPQEHAVGRRIVRFNQQTGQYDVVYEAPADNQIVNTGKHIISVNPVTGQGSMIFEEPDEIAYHDGMFLIPPGMTLRQETFDPRSNARGWTETTSPGTARGGFPQAGGGVLAPSTVSPGSPAPAEPSASAPPSEDPPLAPGDLPPPDIEETEPLPLAPPRPDDGQYDPYDPAVGLGQDEPISPLDPQAVVGGGNKFGQQVSMEGTHKGTDLQAYQGTPVMSPVDGTVVAVDDDPRGLGLQVHVQDARTGNVHTLAHLLDAAVQPGQRVQAGMPIGRVGASGAGATGPHLDYRAQDPQGNYINPESWLGPLGHLPPSPDTVGEGQDDPWDPMVDDGGGYESDPPPDYSEPDPDPWGSYSDTDPGSDPGDPDVLNSDPLGGGLGQDPTDGGGNRTVDGRSFDGLPPDEQAIWRAVYGDQAEAQWTHQANEAFAKEHGYPGDWNNWGRSPASAGSAPPGGAGRAEGTPGAPGASTAVMSEYQRARMLQMQQQIDDARKAEEQRHQIEMMRARTEQDQAREIARHNKELERLQAQKMQLDLSMQGTFGQRTQADLLKSALQNPWLQELSGMAPGYYDPGGPGGFKGGGILQRLLSNWDPGPARNFGLSVDDRGNLSGASGGSQGSPEEAQLGAMLGKNIGWGGYAPLGSPPPTADYGDWEKMTPFERASYRTLDEAAEPWAAGMNRLRMNWGQQGITSARPTTSLQSARLGQVGRIGKNQLAESFGQSPDDYWGAQGKTWSQAAAPKVETLT